MNKVSFQIPLTPEILDKLEKEDITKRLINIEEHLKKKDPSFKIPDPPKGLV